LEIQLPQQSKLSFTEQEQQITPINHGISQITKDPYRKEC